MAKGSKSGKSARDYLSWCGWFLNPATDTELFATLPGWRQRDYHYTHEQRAKGHEPTSAELRRVHEGIPTDGTLISIPSSLTLASLRRRGGKPFDDHLLATLQMTITPEAVVAACTSAGEGTHLVSDRPSGIHAFVWTLAMVRRGAIDSIPLTAFWELEEGIHAETGAVVSTRRDGPLLAWLDGLSADLHAMVV
jgi:hypothetical protein